MLPNGEPGFVVVGAWYGLVCPGCGGALDMDAGRYRCERCLAEFSVRDGIPILLADETFAAHDELDHAHGSHGAHDRNEDGHSGNAKRAQANHFDREVAAEFEIERPRGTPPLYDFLLHEKFRRATVPIGTPLDGVSALSVCAGSGMDAEFLATAGARVVATDISFGAAQRTRERARRHALDLTPIVADVEHLPFPDASFDLVLVHDGLHHLERPEVGLAEMARVARRWVSVTEPARAVATSLAVRAGLALDYEGSGNRVARMRPDDVVGALRRAGYRPLSAGRYAMYYPHHPGRVFEALSLPRVFPVVRAAWRLGNAVLGRAGNKLVVVGERAAS